jgi:hypothetical protein
MHDAAFDARRAKKLKRHRRVQILGFGLIGVILLSVLLAWSAPFIMSARESARRRMLMRLDYPQPPTAPGVYPVTVRPHRHFRDIILATPAMPLEMSPGPDTRSSPALSLEVRAYNDGTTRVDPADTVSITIFGPPGTWPVHGGRVLELHADEKTTRLLSSMDEYLGDGWGLKERDRLDFEIPTEFFVRVANATKSGGIVNSKSFRINAEQQAALRDLAAYLRPGVEIRPPR